MPIVTSNLRVLIKAKAGLAEASLSFGAGKFKFTAAPLFKSIGKPDGVGAASAAEWQVLTPADGTGQLNTWDLCHDLLKGGLGVAGGGQEGPAARLLPGGCGRFG